MRSGHGWELGAYLEDGQKREDEQYPLEMEKTLLGAWPVGVILGENKNGSEGLGLIAG